MPAIVFLAAASVSHADSDLPHGIGATTGHRVESQTLGRGFENGNYRSPDFTAPVEQPPWRLKIVEPVGHTHLSLPPVAFRQGIAWLFSDP